MTTTELIRTREQIVALLKPLFEARAAKNAATKDDKEMSDIVKQWLALNDEDEVDDGEHGIHAFIKPTGTTTWDIRTAKPDLILWLAGEGLLDVKTTAFNERRKSNPSTWLDLAIKHRYAGENETLRVEAK